MQAPNKTPNIQNWGREKSDQPFEYKCKNNSANATNMIGIR